MEKTKKKKSILNGFLNFVENVGNKLPHPVTLFVIFCLAIVVISHICAMMGVSASGELINMSTGEVEMQTINVVSLLSGEGIIYMLTKAVSNFTSFAPLGMVLVAMLGVGLAEGSGYINTILKRAVAVTPAAIITPMVVFLGIMSNIASDAGYVVLIPVGALIFMACGRHPLAGLAAAFAGVSGGFSANLIIGTLDPLLAGISTEAAKIIDPTYVVGPASNWYFMMVSTVVITILGTFVTNKIVEPRLSSHKKPATDDNSFLDVTPAEKKALKIANITLLVMVVGLIAWALPESSILRNPETGSLIDKAPLMDSIVMIITLIFLVPGCVYGFVSGKFKSDKDVGDQLGKSMASMGSYIALVFVAAQFVSYFSYSKLGTVLALKGAEFLQSTGISGIALMLLFILLCAFINLFMGSASAKWAIMAPVFIPMFMALGYSPELTQVAYRIGDSTTNIISPLMNYFAMIVVFAKQYDEESGIGTLVATMLPYSMIFLIGWSILLMVWMYFGLPLGPGAGLML